MTNIHRVYEGSLNEASFNDEDSSDYFLGKKSVGKTNDSKIDPGEIVRDVDELMIINDEAHHIYDPKMAWFKSIEDIHNRLLQKGKKLVLQIDVTATPKNNRGVAIHYAVNITGHGWRKLMRATQPFAYIVEQLPGQLPVFGFLQQRGPVDDAEAYGNFNMGAGFVLYVSEADTDAVLKVAASHNIGALHAGHIERSDDKKVVIKPKGL